jgi:hypothetical protein
MPVPIEGENDRPRALAHLRARGDGRVRAQRRDGARSPASAPHRRCSSSATGSRAAPLVDYENALDGTPLTETQATTVFRVLQEALTNVMRHAAAPRARVRITTESGGAVLRATFRSAAHHRSGGPVGWVSKYFDTPVDDRQRRH